MKKLRKSLSRTLKPSLVHMVAPFKLPQPFHKKKAYLTA